MPKIKDLDRALQYLRAGVPQAGFFSTLDELINNAPFEHGSPEQWQGYLKPGRALTREGVNFPLKAEELQYSGLNDHFLANPGMPIAKQDLLSHLRTTRPEFNITTGLQTGSPRMLHERAEHKEVYPEEWSALDANENMDAYHWQDKYPRVTTPKITNARFSDYAHPPGVPNTYEESITQSPDFGEFTSHFTPFDLSWSRTTRHYLDPQDFDSRNLSGEAREANPVKGPIARLVEEIQSDRHQAAAEKVNTLTPEFRQELINAGHDPELFLEAYPGSKDDRLVSQVRRGYRTPQEDKDVNEFDYSPYREKPPDTPFKNPADYGLLELKKQLLNSVNGGDRYLAIARGKDQAERYGISAERDPGMSHVYDTVYPSALKKLAGQYGAPVQDIEIPVMKHGVNKPDAFHMTGADTPAEYHEGVSEMEHPEYIAAIKELIDEYEAKLPRTSDATDSDIRSARQHLASIDRILSDPESDFFHRDGSDGEAAKQILEHQNNLVDHLSGLGDDWDRMVSANPQYTGSVKKSFPAMQIDPELSAKIKRIGVPLWSLAGVGTAAGLGAYDQQAQANPVEDEAMNQTNGFAKGGDISSALAKLAKLLGRGSEEAAPAVQQSARMPMLGDVTGGSGRNAPRDPRMEDLQSLVNNQPNDAGYNQWTVIKPNGQTHGAPFEFKGSALHVADGLNQQLPGHTVTAIPHDLAPLDRFTPRAPAQDPLKKMTPEEVDELMARTGAGTYTGMAEGGEFDPISSARERVSGQSTPGTPGVSGAIRDAVNALKSYLSGGQRELAEDADQNTMAEVERHADGGTTGVSTDHEQGHAGLLKRFGTHVMEQAYGLDAQGKPALGGRAWTQGQGGTPMGMLDTITAAPHNLLSLMHTTRSLDPIRRHLPGNAEGQAAEDQFFDKVDPQWSKDAADRLERLRSSMDREHGIGEAHTFPEHLTDAAASLVTPVPMAGEGREANAASRLLEMTVPLRPRTLKNYAQDSAVLGGVGTGIDALTQRLARLHAQTQQPQGGGSPVDPTRFSEDMGVQPVDRPINNNHQMVPLVGDDGRVVFGVDPQTF